MVIAFKGKTQEKWVLRCNADVDTKRYRCRQRAETADVVWTEDINHMSALSLICISCVSMILIYVISFTSLFVVMHI